MKGKGVIDTYLANFDPDGLGLRLWRNFRRFEKMTKVRAGWGFHWIEGDMGGRGWGVKDNDESSNEWDIARVLGKTVLAPTRLRRAGNGKWQGMQRG